MATTKSSKKIKAVSSPKPSKNIISKKRDRGQTEDRLIDAGIEVFSDMGYDAATTKLISTKSCVNESLIMRYFGGKEGLLLEIIRRFFAQHHNTPLPYPPQATLTEELLCYIRTFSQKSSEDRCIFRIMLLRACVDPRFRKKVLSFMNPEGDPQLSERLKELRSKKKIPSHLSDRLIHLLSFEKLSTIFISEILFETDKQKEISQASEVLTIKTMQALLKA